jgi:hypothetical protein
VSHDLASFRVLKTDTYATFKSIVAQALHYPESHIRLWVLVNRQNKTIRPDTHIPEDEATLRECKEFGVFEIALADCAFSGRGDPEYHGCSTDRLEAVLGCHRRCKRTGMKLVNIECVLYLYYCFTAPPRCQQRQLDHDLPKVL